MLDFCGKHGIVLPYETIGADSINVAYDRSGRTDACLLSRRGGEQTGLFFMRLSLFIDHVH